MVGCCSEDDDNRDGDAAATAAAAAAEAADGMLYSLFSHWFVSSVMWSRLGLGKSAEFPDSKSIEFMVDSEGSSQECSFIVLLEGAWQWRFLAGL